MQAAKTDAQKLREETRIALGTKEAARYLYVTEHCLYQWASEGRGPVKPMRMGRKLLWPVAEIKRALRVA